MSTRRSVAPTTFLLIGALCAAGALVPAGMFVFDHGWDLARFVRPLTSNSMALILALDLLLCTGMFLVWSYRDAKRRNVRGWPLVVAATCVALSCGIPLYFYLRERAARSDAGWR